MKKVLLIFIFQFIFIYFFKAQNPFDNAVKSFLSNKEISTATVGIQLQNQNGKELFSYNSNKLLVPASTQKLFTAAFTLNTLPINFTFKTVVATKEIDSTSNSINGDLIVSTDGDPSLESRFFKSNSFLRNLKSTLTKQNIKSIKGNILIYPRINDYQHNKQWLWSDIGNYYGAGFSTHTFMDNYVEVSFNSSLNIGDTTSILKISPSEKSFSIKNNVLVGISKKDLSFAFGAPYQDQRIMTGTIPANKNNYAVKVSMHNPKAFLFSAIENTCLDLNIKILNNKDNLEKLDTLLIHHSPSLTDLLKCVNFQSNNNFAEHLLMKSASYKNQKNISFEDAPEILENYWKEQLPSNDFVFMDGCGLSRLNLASPASFNQLLTYQLQSDNLKVFLETLPVFGTSGTLKYMGDGTIIEGNFIGKSGSMTGVRCYSGYFKKNNEYYPFTIMINNFVSSDYLIRKHIESLMVAIYKNL